MGAALEIMRASQLDLAAMDEGPSPPPVSLLAERTPEAHGFQASGNRLLSLLQVRTGDRRVFLPCSVGDVNCNVHCPGECSASSKPAILAEISAEV